MPRRKSAQIKKLIPADLADDYAQVGAADLIDKAKQFLPVLKPLSDDLPYVKTAVAAIKFPRTLSDILLGRKVYEFLYASNLNEEKLKKLHKKFSRAKQERLWERVILSINSHDDAQKSAIIGKLFVALLDEYIDEEEFFSLVHATNTLDLELLEGLRQVYMLSDTSEPHLKTSTFYALAMLGLIDISNGSVGISWGSLGTGSGPAFPANQLGWKYIGIVFDFPDSNLPGIKVGEGVLISEIGEQGTATNKVYPLKHFQSTGKRYRQAEVFEFSKDKQVLCDETNGLPVTLFKEPVPAGVDPSRLVWVLIGNDMTSPTAIFLSKSGDGTLQRHAFLAIGEIVPSYTLWRSVDQVMNELAERDHLDDHERYIQDVTKQIERYVKGELTLSP